MLRHSNSLRLHGKGDIPLRKGCVEGEMVLNFEQKMNLACGSLVRSVEIN
jgi:hypothetical protein